jgi:CDP-diacylglycerol--glycerol-3-phosphate 3-phosphatidyltransferase
VNLPNAITVGRILIAPLIAALPFINSPFARLAAFVIYIVAAVSDYYDGMLARTRNLITDLADPISATTASFGAAHSFRFQTPLGPIGLPWWVMVIVLGRELFMTIFRHLAARRGVVISAIGPAKWKTGFQSVWVGAAYFWFFAATLAAVRRWDNAAWKSFAYFNGIVGTVTMAAAVFLTIYSLGLYMRRYRHVFSD